MFVYHQIKYLVQTVTRLLLSFAVGSWEAETAKGKANIRAAPGDLTKLDFMIICMTTHW